ncbi:MAG: hypothetical protein JO061_03955 [Acidobacteriaceae bacterium]|nr:hypothetical protein [Acidobacteriaceae bacterium]
MPTLPVTVRWDSALPVREALVRSHSAEARDTENTLATRDKYYVLTILGLGTAGNSDKTMLRQGLLNEARLMRHGKKPIMPEDARIDEKTGTIQIFFPKTDPITLDDKEVAFGTVFGTVQVIQRFRLKDMVYKGKLEL